MADVNRRDLFRRSFTEFGSFMREKVDEKIAESMPPPIIFRPPGALDEPQFLDACTKCNECSEACPYGCIYPLYDHNPKIDQTPTITPDLEPCRMCEDFPCIKVCEPKALVMPEKGVKPKIGLAQILIDGCFTWNGEECDSCHDSCPEKAIIFDSEKRARVKNSICTGCGECAVACPVGEYALRIVPLDQVEG